MADLAYYRDTWVEIKLDKIARNVEAMRRHVPSDIKIMAVVKANGYGHGAIQVAKTALEAGADALAVAILDEALQLRKAGITAPILVLGWVRPEDAPLAAKHQVTLTVFQTDWIEEAVAALRDEGQPHLTIHVKLDTGMGRIGLRNEAEVKGFIEKLRDFQEFLLEGIFTHFATADERKTNYYEKQYQQFVEMIEIFHRAGFNPPLIHAANSAAALRFPEQAFNMIRLGIAMYGLSPSEEMKDLLPFRLEEAFSLHSKLIHVKELEPGESVSYGATYTASKKEWIGTVPIGYADGWIRKLSGISVLCNGQRVPIIGRICMDQLMIRLPEKLERGTTVTLIGCDGDECITMDEVARYLDTINYEIPCMISERVPRIFYKNNQMIEANNPILHD